MLFGHTPRRLLLPFALTLTQQEMTVLLLLLFLLASAVVVVSLESLDGRLDTTMVDVDLRLLVMRRYYSDMFLYCTHTIPRHLQQQDGYSHQLYKHGPMGVLSRRVFQSDCRHNVFLPTQKDSRAPNKQAIAEPTAQAHKQTITRLIAFAI